MAQGCTYLLTYSMEQSQSWEADWFSVSQEIPRILWNPTFHYHINKSPPLVPMQSISPGQRLSVRTFCNVILFYGEELLAPRPTLQAGGSPLVGCPRLLIQYICNYPPDWRLFFHPQVKDAPCRGDRDPLSWTQGYTLWINKIMVVQWCLSSDSALRNSDLICNNAQTNAQFLYLHSCCIHCHS